jgi:hypothetical protein
MKKVTLISICVIFTTVSVSAQSKILRKGSLSPTDPKESISFLKQGTINKDSTLSKTSNGFDVKKSNIDNMVYLNTNETNPALNKMPVVISNKPVELMPVATLPRITNLSLKDSNLNVILNSPFFKRMKKN